jgi:GR25 family glycosyltransferase involved in LPS biosynthesis
MDSIPKYCISFQDDTRKDWSSKQFKKHNIDVRFVDGVNPSTDLYLLEELGVTIESPIKNGNLGSFLAHRKTWKMCLENEISWIFEDDLYIKDNWKEVEKCLYLLNTTTPTVIKLCAFTTDGRLSNETPSKNDIHVSGSLYKCHDALSNLSYLFNKAFVQKLWEDCKIIRGKTLDYEMQSVIRESNCYAFYPNLMVQSQECKSIRHKMNDLGGWSISKELLEDLLKFPKGTKMVELGSGDGTKYLVSHFSLISIEQNEKYLNLHHDNYIYAPIKKDWFDLGALKGKDLSCEILLVDAPFGTSRRGVIDNFHLFKSKTVIFDDVNRPKDLEIALEFCKKYGYKYEIKGADKQHLIAWAD